MKNYWFLILLFFFSCKNGDGYKQMFGDPELYSKTVHELNEVVMGNNFPPIVASRNYTYAAIAGYEVMVVAEPARYRTLAGQIHGLDSLPIIQDTAGVYFPLASLLAYCRVGEAVTFPEGSMKYYVDSLKQLALSLGMPSNMLDKTDSFSAKVASHIIAWGKKDNYAETRSAEKYTVLDIPGRWVPTPPMYASAVEPHWNEIRTLVLDSANQFRPVAPIPFDMKDSTSLYYKNIMMVKTTGENLTDEQKHIANFWDDNPFKLNVYGHAMFSTKKFSPPGHWMGIIGIAAKQAKVDFAETTYAYAITSIVMFDAFIECWDAKYTYNTIRPESVINKYIDANWRPLLQTPAFPEYTCGHSTVSASAAEALTKVFGSNFSYTDTTELEFGIESRKYNSFRAAAEENNLARFYGGIHLHNSCLVSTEAGKQVGIHIATKLSMKKEN
ncbi:MAG: phosphoesterase PA-phosphatase [Chitinophagaceae bacterium]|nr:MAG: phosphoesterase PA-phosphatase [Chitinophagaceae bacterium]